MPIATQASQKGKIVAVAAPVVATAADHDAHAKSRIAVVITAVAIRIIRIVGVVSAIISAVVTTAVAIICRRRYSSYSRLKLALRL